MSLPWEENTGGRQGLQCRGARCDRGWWGEAKMGKTAPKNKRSGCWLGLVSRGSKPPDVVSCSLPSAEAFCVI